MPERDVSVVVSLTDRFSGPGRAILRTIGKIGKAAVKMGRLATSAFNKIRRAAFSLRTLLLGAVFVGIGKVFADFESGLANVATLVDTTEVSMQQLGKTVLEVSSQTGEGLDSLNKALFDTISAGVDAAKAQQVLAQASTLAKAGATSTADATKGLVAIMNSYSLAVEDATAVSDALFQAQKAGITTISELSVNVGKVAPTARLAGVSIDEMLAATASLTKSGISTTQAITSLKSVLTGLIKPTATAKETAKLLGIELSTASVRGGKFLEFIQQVSEKTANNETLLARLFGNVKAFQAIANLAADDAKNFSEILESMGDKAGSTAEAFAKVADTTAFKFSVLLAEIKRFFVQIGEAAKPFIDGTINKLRDAIKSIRENENQVRSFIQNLFNALKKVAAVVKSIFSQGDIIRFVINLVTGAITAATRTAIAGLPVIIRVAQRIGREIGIALVDAIFGTANEQVARQLAKGGEGPLGRAGLRLLGVDEAEQNRLRDLGKQLQAAEANLEIQQARGAQGAAGSEALARYQRALRDVDRIRQKLAGDAFDEARASDERILEAQVSQFLSTTKGIAKDFFAKLPEGLSQETQDAMKALADSLGPEWTAAMNEAMGKDEAARKDAAKKAGEEVGAAFAEGAGTGAGEFAGGLDLGIAEQEIRSQFESLKSAMEEFRTARDRIISQREGGFISGPEAARREEEAIAGITRAVGVLAERIQFFRGEAENPVILEIFNRSIQEITTSVASFKEEITGLNTEVGTLATGFTAGLEEMIVKLADLREAGMQAGAALTTSLFDGLVVAVTKGREAFKQYAADFLKRIALLIARAIFFQAVLRGLRAAGGGGGALATAISSQLHEGGTVPGPNVNADVTPALLTPGEYVQPRETVEHYGTGFMEALRRRLVPKSALAGFGGRLRPIPVGRMLQAGGQAPPPDSAPKEGFVVANEQNLDRLLNGGPNAFWEFFKRNADTARGILRTEE